MTRAIRTEGGIEFPKSLDLEGGSVREERAIAVFGYLDARPFFSAVCLPYDNNICGPYYIHRRTWAPREKERSITGVQGTILQASKPNLIRVKRNRKPYESIKGSGKVRKVTAVEIFT
uniref:Uncharacterized protein n=1 Tax=Vespula pensylvanica TaxID=30213 RepID=A0A834P7W6_VESPE|nr:hypothetical protein H0235_004750 [Vespula pensylvanica]